MRSDSYILVECDAAGCQDSVEVQAPFPYSFRTSDSQVDREIERAGWVVVDGRDYCSKECSERGEGGRDDG